jgi:hypothetical protein
LASKDPSRSLALETGASDFDLDLGGVPLSGLMVRQGARNSCSKSTRGGHRYAPRSSTPGCFPSSVCEVRVGAASQRATSRRISSITPSRKFVRKSLGFICTELAATAHSCSPRPAQSRGCLPRVSGPGCHWRPLGRNSARRNREWPRDAPLGSWPLGTRDGRHIQSPVLGRASGEGEDPDATSLRPSSFALCLPPEWASKTDTAMLDEGY